MYLFQMVTNFIYCQAPHIYISLRYAGLGSALINVMGITRPDGLECRGEGVEFGLDCAGYAVVAGIVGVEEVHFLAVEVARMVVFHREEAAFRIEVNEGYCPECGCFAEGVDIALNVETLTVGIVLVGLDIALVESRVATMDWSHDDDLLVGIGVFQIRHRTVDIAGECRIVHEECAVFAFHNRSVDVHAVKLLGVEFPDGHTVVIVIRSGPDEDGINRIAHGIVKFLGFFAYTVPLVAATGMDFGLDSHEGLKIFPIMLFSGFISGVGHRVAQKGNTFAIPRSVEVDVRCGNVDNRSVGVTVMSGSGV